MHRSPHDRHYPTVRSPSAITVRLVDELLAEMARIPDHREYRDRVYHDARRSQIDMAETVADQGGSTYLLAIKQNQEALHAHLARGTRL